MDHDAKFHERRIHGTASSIDNIDVEFPDRLCNRDIGLPDTTLSYICLGKWNTDPAEYAAWIYRPQGISYRRAIISASSG
jgi:hypothetical protein